MVRPQAGAESGGGLPRLDLRTLIRIRLGDHEVRERFLEAWAPVVETEARRYARRGGPLDDLQSEGLLALWEAALHFDPQRHRTSPERYVHNHVHRRVRKAYREAMGFGKPAQVPLELVPNTAALDHAYVSTEQRLDLQAAAVHLQPREQETLAQYLALAASGAGPDEAARLLSRSSGTGFSAWKKRIERVRKKVKDHLQGVPSREN